MPRKTRAEMEANALLTKRLAPVVRRAKALPAVAAHVQAGEQVEQARAAYNAAVAALAAAKAAYGATQQPAATAVEHYVASLTGLDLMNTPRRAAHLFLCHVLGLPQPAAEGG